MLTQGHFLMQLLRICLFFAQNKGLAMPWEFSSLSQDTIPGAGAPCFPPCLGFPPLPKVPVFIIPLSSKLNSPPKIQMQQNKWVKALKKGSSINRQLGSHPCRSRNRGEPHLRTLFWNSPSLGMAERPGVTELQSLNFFPYLKEKR